jgi:hypothetical protein
MVKFKKEIKAMLLNGGKQNLFHVTLREVENLVTSSRYINKRTSTCMPQFCV